jgi:hypothetical protein
MFQKDYWSMNDQELAKIARKYKIVCYGGEKELLNRDFVIASLVGRDTVHGTGTATAIAGVSLLISLVALWVSIIK